MGKYVSYNIDGHKYDSWKELSKRQKELVLLDTAIYVEPFFRAGGLVLVLGAILGGLLFGGYKLYQIENTREPILKTRAILNLQTQTTNSNYIRRYHHDSFNWTTNNSINPSSISLENK
jgi:hypothetical protein